MPVAAVIGAAAIGAGASVISGTKAANAQKDAAVQATQVQRDQMAEAARQYDQNRADLAPYRAVGTGALTKLSNLMGIPGQQTPAPATNWGDYVRNNPAAMAAYNQQVTASSAGGGQANFIDGQYGNYQGYGQPQYTPISIDEFGQNYYNTTGKAAGDTIDAYTPKQDQPSDFGSLDRSFGLSDFQKDPGYAFRRDEGAKGVDASAAARGGVLSGGALKAMARYQQDYASNEYGKAYDRFNNDQTTRFNRLSALAGTGQTATNQGIAAGQALTQSNQQGVNNITSNINAAGNATASQYAGIGNAIGGFANNVGNYFALKGLGGTGGGVSLPNYGRMTTSGVGLLG